MSDMQAGQCSMVPFALKSEFVKNGKLQSGQAQIIEE
jgi:hypothetical protein